MQKKTLMVTGAGGFVGHHVLSTFNDYSIIAVSKEDSLSQKYADVSYEKADILELDRLSKIISTYKPDAILHLAAIAPTWFSDVKIIFDVNVIGTANLYEAIKAQKTEGTYNPRVVYVSSSEVYGNTLNPDDITELSPTFPTNPYAVSKLAADRLSYMYAQRDNLDIVIARPFNHAGPGQAKGFFIPDMASQIAEIQRDDSKKTVRVGNLEAVRDFTDVRDVVRAYKSLLEVDCSPGETFNICSGTGIKISDVLEKLLKLSKKEITIEQDPQKMRPSDVPVFIGNNSKLKKLTGWEPKIDFADTLKETLDYWLSLKKI